MRLRNPWERQREKLFKRNSDMPNEIMYISVQKRKEKREAQETKIVSIIFNKPYI